MQHHPNQGSETWPLHRVDSNDIEQVMQCDHSDASGSDQTDWQMDQHREYDHRNANDPNHLQLQREVKIDVEPYDHPDESEFQQHEPKPALDQKFGQFRLTFAARHLQKSARPGQKHKNRRAKVRDPASEEKQDAGPGEVRGIKIQHVTMNEFAR